MLNYVNSISCSTNDKKTEFIFSFRQVHPVVGIDGEVKETAVDTVSEIVLSLEATNALKDLLERMLNTGEVVE